MPRHRESDWLTHPRRAPEPASIKLLSLLGAPTHERGTEWMHEGACASSSHPEWWFPTRGRYTEDSRKAVRTCVGECPVRAQCLKYAVGLHDGKEGVQGIWAGTTPDQRDALVPAYAARTAS